MGLEEIIEDWKGKPIREVILDLYIDKNMTMRGVAKELHLSVGQVYNLCKKYGISKNSNILD